MTDSPAPGFERAAAYGDGLFETLRAHGHVLPWWPRHWARLACGAQRLGIVLPQEQDVYQAATRALQQAADGGQVLRLHVARAPAGRGYAPGPADTVAQWQVQVHPLPVTPADIGLRWCATRLAAQPALAGLKHCNRLEQVLARLEWRDAPADERDAFEGLMRDMDGAVVCATSANVFARVEGRWRTPPMDRCGVAGICRAWVLDTLDADVAALSPGQVETADAVFLTNAVRGILPAARLGHRRWAPHPETAALQRALAAAHPGFAPA